jgi:hypothetical protein
MAGMQGTDVTYVTRPSRQLLDRDTYFILSRLALTLQKLVKIMVYLSSDHDVDPVRNRLYPAAGVLTFEVSRWK